VAVRHDLTHNPALIADYGVVSLGWSSDELGQLDTYTGIRTDNMRWRKAIGYFDIHGLPAIIENTAYQNGGGAGPMEPLHAFPKGCLAWP
jgi:hypothetical protein